MTLAQAADHRRPEPVARPPRVGLIGPVPPQAGGDTPGGVATHHLYLARALAAAGQPIRMLATNAVAKSPKRWQEPGGDFPLFRQYLPRTLGAWSAPSYLSAVGAEPLVRTAAWLSQQPVEQWGSRRTALAHLVWYQHFLRVSRPALLHVQHPLERAQYALSLRSLGVWRGPLIITAHSLFGEHPESVIQGQMAPRLLQADAVIAVSPHIAEQARTLGVQPERIRVIRSGVDTQAFTPCDSSAARAELKVPTNAPLVLFAGTLEPRKGVDRLLRAFAMTRTSVPGALLVVIGTGEGAGADDQSAILHGLASSLGLLQAAAVSFHGRVSDADLKRWYAASTLLALPSSAEGQGIVALEAMASGRPVVGSAVGGLVSTVEDGQTGRLVPAGDVAALADALRGLLENQALADEMGQKARLSVMKRFSWAVAAEETARLYSEVGSRPWE